MKKIDLRSVIIGVLLTIIFIISTGSYKNTPVAGNKIKAQAFQVVDANGNVCGAFGTTDDGSICSFSMGSLIAENKFSVHVNQEDKPQDGNVVLKIQGKRGELRITSGPYGDKGPVMYMSNQQGKGVMDLGVAGDPGNGFLRINLRDPNKAGVSTYQMPKGQPLMIFDEEGLLWANPPR